MQESGLQGRQNSVSADGQANSGDNRLQEDCQQSPSAPIRWLFVVCGLVLTGLAVLGAVLPGLPTTPFLLLAVALFARSSPRLHRMLLNSRLLGPYLRDWQQYRAIRGRVRNTAVIAVAAGLSITLMSTGVPNWIKVVVLGAGTTGLIVIFRLPLLERQAAVDNGTPAVKKRESFGSESSADAKHE